MEEEWQLAHFFQQYIVFPSHTWVLKGKYFRVSLLYLTGKYTLTVNLSSASEVENPPVECLHKNTTGFSDCRQTIDTMLLL